jgi:ribosome-associated protein
MQPDPKLLYPEIVFQTARSGGSGGQNVNKVETKVELRFDVFNSAILTDAQKAFLLEKLPTKISTEGILVLQHQTERSQLANKEKVIKKFNELIIKVFTPVVKRRKTRVPAGVKAARRKDKERRSEIKANRKVTGF